MKETSSKPWSHLGALTVAVGGLAALLGATACNPTVTFGSLDDGASPPIDPQSIPSCVDKVADVGKEALGLTEHDGWLYFFETHYPPGGYADLELTSDILRVPVTGGVPDILAHDVPHVGDLGVQGERIYWAERLGAIRSSALDGSDVQLLHQATPELAAQSIAVSQDRVFWGASDGAIRSVPLGGGAVVDLRGPTSDAYARELAIGGSTLYFIDTHFLTSDVSSMSTDGGPTSILLGDQEFLSNLLLHGDELFVSDSGGWMESTPDEPSVGAGRIRRIDLTGASPIATLATDQPFPNQMAADESGLYWGGGAGQDPTYVEHPDFPDVGTNGLTYVHRAAAESSAAQPVSQLLVVFSITACGGAMCWVNADTHTIERYRECVP